MHSWYVGKSTQIIPIDMHLHADTDDSHDHIDALTINVRGPS